MKLHNELMHLVLMLMFIERIIDIEFVLTVAVINKYWISSFVINSNKYYEVMVFRPLKQLIKPR